LLQLITVVNDSFQPHSSSLHRPGPGNETSQNKSQVRLLMVMHVRRVHLVHRIVHAENGITRLNLT